jgi:putative ABC transport system substrate-binding protein
MQRRDFIKVIAGSAVVWPFAARAQRTAKPVIGFLGPASPSTFASRIEAFRLGLRDFGYIEGTNITVEYRWAEGRYERLPKLAAELVRSNVDLIVTHGTPGSLAAKRATTTIPIVMANKIKDPARPSAHKTDQSRDRIPLGPRRQ